MCAQRFYVHDLDSSGPPPAERLTAVCQALVRALAPDKESPPDFTRIRNALAGSEGSTLDHLPTRVSIDNDTSERSTVIDVFAHDRLGLLYVITRTLFELELSISAARIGTYLDQVVDVFFVTDREGRKVTEDGRLAHIRGTLLEAIERHRTS